MKQLFKEVYTQLSSLKDSQGNPAYIRMWNNQAVLVWEGKMQLFPCPAHFIEFTTANTVGLMGGEGVQLYDPVIIAIHTLDWQLDANGEFIDGGFEQNLTVFDHKQDVYKLLQKFKPTKGSPMVRMNEQQDYTHAGIYHFIQYYQTTWVDEDMQEPVGGSETDGTTTLEAAITVEGSVDESAPHVIDLPQSPVGSNLLDSITASGEWSVETTGGITRFTTETDAVNFLSQEIDMDSNTWYTLTFFLHNTQGGLRLDVEGQLHPPVNTQGAVTIQFFNKAGGSNNVTLLTQPADTGYASVFQGYVENIILKKSFP